MSFLIDEVIKYTGCRVEFNGQWYIAKPLTETGWYYSPWAIRKWIMRIKDAIEILRDKAIAIHYKEDEKGNKGGVSGVRSK